MKTGYISQLNRPLMNMSRLFIDNGNRELGHKIVLQVAEFFTLNDILIDGILSLEYRTRDYGHILIGDHVRELNERNVRRLIKYLEDNEERVQIDRSSKDAIEDYIDEEISNKLFSYEIHEEQ